MSKCVPYSTDFGIYWVTPEDKKLLDLDKTVYGHICMAPNKNGTSTRLNPANVLQELYYHDE